MVFVNHFLRCSAVVPGYTLKATWPKQPKLPSRSDPAVLSSGWDPLSRSGNPGEDINCQSLFCEETFSKCILGCGDPSHVTTNNINHRISSSCSCYVVFDCLDQRGFLPESSHPTARQQRLLLFKDEKQMRSMSQSYNGFYFFLASERQIFFSVYI